MDQTIFYENFDNICRLCLCSTELRSIFVDPKVAIIYKYITNIRIKENDKLPKNICENCIQKLENIVLFIETCKSNDAFLKAIVFQEEDKSLLASQESGFIALNQKIQSVEQILVRVEGKGENEDDLITLKIVRETEPNNEENEAKTNNRDEIKKHNRMFPCKQCNKKFSRPAHLRLHVYRHKKRIKALSCEKCKNSFLTITALTRHTCLLPKNRTKPVNKKDGNSKKRNDMCLCVYCNKYLTRKSDLKRHLRTHTGIKLFKCEVCNRSFSHKTALTRHSFLHTDKFKCNVCNKQFTREIQLKNHIEKGHVTTKNVENQCNFCAKKFKSKSYLQAHARLHTGKANYRCDICSKAFPFKAALNRHHLSHTSVKEFKCDKCEAEFNLKCLLNKHKKCHEENSEEKSKLTCSDCGKYFLFPSQLKQHKLVHNSNKIKLHKPQVKTHSSTQEFLCSYCGKKFSYKCNLKAHLKRHIEKYVPREICNKRCSTKPSSNHRLLAHKEEKPCPCPYCGKQFRKASLYKHLLIHKGDKRFECEVCKNGFVRKDQLTQHLRVHKT